MTPRYDLPRAAPQPLRLVQEFINTLASEHDRELLATPEALHEWLAERGVETPARISRDDLERTHELREAVRGLLQQNRGRSGEDPSLPAERLAAGAPLRVTFAGPRPQLVPAGGGISAAHARILAIILEASLSGTWQRLKACRQCRWVFYDASKNRSATWCSMAICGNRRKTREYRRRRRTHEG